MAHHIGDLSLGDEAKVAGAYGRIRRLGLELAASLMDVDFLSAEMDGRRATALLARDDARAEHVVVKRDTRREVAHGQHEMIDAIDGKGHSAGAAAGTAL